MEYILRETDIFDPKLADKFYDLFKDDLELFEDDKYYNLTVSFHVNSNDHLTSFMKFELPPLEKKITRKNSDYEKEKKYDVLSYQLKELEDILVINDIKFHMSTIQGEELEFTDNIKIVILENEPKNNTNKNGKKKLWICRSIMPSRPYTTSLINDFYAKRMNKLYHRFFSIIKDKKIISEILEVEETQDINLLFKAFIEQYGDLWMTTEEREKELINKLKNRCLEVLQKYIDEEQKQNDDI
ncbi:hypothetical protein [Paenibacillus tundrae]|uniref:Uncharacterized protein n=1 Tax=Paenibacillus tundrae TaxID=528187 RepID=A0ABT9W7I6_9BACL|nr:hypothetical protein [Paenibacillus tundrae]MDQ0169199.1 hypothetical protein [Paenibacillus tundrae]